MAALLVGAVTLLGAGAGCGGGDDEASSSARCVVAVDDLERVDCDDPHGAEVVPLADDEACDEATFERYTGTPPSLSELRMTSVGGSCLLTLPGHRVERPFLDSGEVFFAPTAEERDDEAREEREEEAEDDARRDREGEPSAPVASPGFGRADLDALGEDCFAGDGAACDDLLFAAPVGSDAESYGTTCAGRFEGDQLPGSCADALP